MSSVRHLRLLLMVRDALIIGINRYTHVGVEQQLQAPARDAELIARRLEQNAWQVTRLPETTFENGKRQISTKKLVTAQELEEAITSLFYPRTKKNIPDAALLYFSGHGVRQDKGWKTKGFLATSDVDLQTNWGYSLEELRELLRASPIRAQVVFLDCCYSGELLNFEEGNPGSRGQARDRFFIAAAQDHELAYEAADVPYSELTRVLWNGLAPRELGVSSFDLQQSIGNSFQGKQRPLCYSEGIAIPLIPATQHCLTRATVIREENPYQGLMAFEPQTAEFFFGRDKAWHRLLGKLHDCPFAFVVGVSGSGKSSLVRAKLWPYYEEQGYQVLIIKPWSNPMQRLRDKLTETLADQAIDIGVVEHCIEEEGLPAALDRFPFPKVFLIVDQFEEVFTVCNCSSERQQFIDTLVKIMTRSSRDLMMVATMRADFLSHCGDHQLDEVINDQMVWVAAMSPTELRSVIVEPAAVQGYQIKEELVREILRELQSDPHCLPLLEFGLQKLWEKRDCQSNQITLDHYESMGGLVEIIDRHAEALFFQQSQQGQAWMRRIFLKLLRFGQELRDNRQREERRVLLEMGTDATQRQEIEGILRVLEGKTGRLLVASEEEGKAIIDLAHEVLLEGWKRFEAWRQENRDLRRLLQRVEDAEKEWRNKGRREGYLLPEGLVREVEGVRELLETEQSLSAAVWSYFNASLSYHNSQQDMARGFLMSEAFQQCSKRLISIAGNGEAVLEGIHEYASELFDTGNMYVALYYEMDDIVEFKIVYIRGEKVEHVSPRKLSECRGKTEHIIRTRKPLRHTSEESALWYNTQGCNYGYVDSQQPWLGVPILHDQGDYERCLGVIATFSSDKSYVYSELEQAMLENIGRLVAIALENSIIVEEVAKQQDMLTRSIASQDFINRLNSATGTVPIWLQLLDREIDKFEGVNIETSKEYIFNCLKELKELDRQIHSLEEMEAERLFHIDEILRPLVEQFRILYKSDIDAGKLSIECALPECIYDLVGFPSVVFHSLESVLKNGVDAVLEKGKGCVRIVAENANENTVKIMITDTGVGIPDTIKSNIFSPFFTTKKTGGGYSLWRTEAIFERMGGSISFSSQPGKSTTFIITLPRG